MESVNTNHQLNQRPTNAELLTGKRPLKRLYCYMQATLSTAFI